MKVLFSPQVREHEKIVYVFADDTVEITYINFESEEEIEDVFDFSKVPDGELKFDSISTELPFNPFISLRKESGTTYAELINLIGMSPTEKECFPDWFDTEKETKNEQEEININEVDF